MSINKKIVTEKEESRILLLFLLKKFNEVCAYANIPSYASGGTCLGAIRHQGFIPWDDDIDVMIPRDYYDIFVNTCKIILKEPVIIRTRENDPYFCQEYIKLCYHDDVTGYSDLSLDVFFLDETDPSKAIFRALQNALLISLYTIKLYKVSKDGKGKKYIPHNIVKRVLLEITYFIPYKTIDSLHKKIMTAEKKPCDYLVNWGSCYSYKKATYKKTVLGTPRFTKFENTEVPVAEHCEIILKQLYGEDYMTPPPLEKRGNHGNNKLICSKLNIDQIRKEVGI